MAAQLRTIDTSTLANLSRIMVGVDRILSARMAATNGNYPPHNIVKYNENRYGIEIAIAGFSKEEINVVVDQNVITVRGEHIPSIEDVEYLHRGIAARNFVIEFPLAEYMEVRDATINDGLLKITLEYVMPESLKPRQIEIK